MTKGQIYFSNDLSTLVEIFKTDLVVSAAPFERRMVVVPHLGLKNFLMKSLAKDPLFQVAAGLEIVNFSQGFSKMIKELVPTTLELSLFLQHALVPMIDTEPELQNYFSTSAREERIGPFCDRLAQYFHRYGTYGHTHLISWQKKLWAKVTKKFHFPKGAHLLPSQVRLHVFGASFIPQAYLDHYIALDAQIYLFSPCAIFWGDFYTAKEKEWLQKEMTLSQKDLFSSSFEDQNTLLANWGKVGRKMALMLEQSSLPVEEYYQEIEGEKALFQLQRDVLSGSFSKPKSDDSIQIVNAVSTFHEVEVLKQTILKLCHETQIKLDEIQVLAPDISLYYSSIAALFSDIPYEISDLELIQLSPIAKGFKKLLALIENRFSTDAILELFQISPFRDKFDLQPDLIEKWIKTAKINWGFSEKQKEEFLEKKHLSPIGTWEWGLKRLVLGLGDLKGVAAIEVTEMEMFNRLYLLIHSLADDLAVLYDGTKWTISTWLRYFCALLESYFITDPSEDLYQGLQKYALSSDALDEVEVTFTSMERVIDQILHQKTKISSSSNLQSIHFGSLTEGSVRPCRALCLIGLNEENFPRQEETSSLCMKEEDYRPTSQDTDRFLLLQALMSTKQRLYISHIKDQPPSPLIEELLNSLEGGEIVSHKPIYPINGHKLPPLIKEFYEQVPLPKVSPFAKVETDKLFKFARHPLRYYLHEVLGLYPERKAFGEDEYLLNPLTKIELVKQALHTSIGTVLEEAKERGALPVDPLIPLAKEQILKELENWQLTIDAYGIDPKQITTTKISLTVGSTKLEGKLDLYTPQGLLVRGSSSLEDKIRFWPQVLIMQELGLPVILIKDQKTLTITGSLDEYLQYFALSHHLCSPLIPELAKPLLEKGDLKKGFKNLEDEAVSWVIMRDGIPSQEAILHNWKERLSHVFGGVNANV